MLSITLALLLERDSLGKPHARFYFLADAYLRRGDVPQRFGDGRKVTARLHVHPAAVLFWRRRGQDFTFDSAEKPRLLFVVFSDIRPEQVQLFAGI